MNTPDRDPNVIPYGGLVTDYPPKGTIDTLAQRALRLLEEEREILLDQVQEITDAIRRIKEGGV